MLNAAAAATRSLARSAWAVFVPAVLPISSYGAYSVLQTTAGVVAQIGLLGTPQTILREPATKLPIGGLFLHSLLLAIVAIPLAMLAAPVQEPRYVWLLAFVVIGLIGYAIGITRAKAIGAFSDVFHAELVGGGAIVLAILTVVLLLVVRGSIDYGVIVVLEGLAAVAILIALGRSVRGSIGRDEWRIAGTIGVLPSVYSVGGLVVLDLLIWRRLEIYFLQGSPDGLHGVAVFGLASQLATLLLLFPTAVVEAWSPALATQYRVSFAAFDTRFRANRRVYHRTFALVLAATVVGTPIVVRVGFAKYWPWVWDVMAFAVIRVLCNYAGFHSSALYATKRERWLYVPVILGGVVGLGSNALLTLRWGLTGAVVAYGLTQATVAVTTLGAFHRSRRSI
jgi:O-antigen/teichoic acid export membrane protein